MAKIEKGNGIAKFILQGTRTVLYQALVSLVLHQKCCKNYIFFSNISINLP